LRISVETIQVVLHLDDQGVALDSIAARTRLPMKSIRRILAKRKSADVPHVQRPGHGGRTSDEMAGDFGLSKIGRGWE
jgi:hypothetical protein